MHEWCQAYSSGNLSLVDIMLPIFGQILLLSTKIRPKELAEEDLTKGIFSKILTRILSRKNTHYTT